MMLFRNYAKEKRTILFISLILLQVLILAMMVFNSYTVILWGEEVLFQVMPIDPRSLFQGDYVILSYPFSNLDLTKVEYDFDPAAISYQERVYLVLEPDGDTWGPVMITKDKSKLKGKTYLEAKALYTMPGMPEPFEKTVEARAPGSNEPAMTVLRLKLSIEQFFVPEGKGKEIEERIKNGDIYANVAIYKGRARVIELINK